MLAWVNVKTVWGFGPSWADGVRGCEALKSFPPSGAVVGHQEGLELRLQLLGCLVIISSHRGVFQRPVHAFNLPVRPGVVGRCSPVFDAVFVADSVKEMLEGSVMPGLIGALDAGICQNRMALIRHRVKPATKEVCGNRFGHAVMSLGIGELAEAVDGDEQR